MGSVAKLGVVGYEKRKKPLKRKGIKSGGFGRVQICCSDLEGQKLCRGKKPVLCSGRGKM